MTMYKYYAVITKEEDCYFVQFPDLENVFTDGNSLSDAIAQAEDVLGLMLSDAEERQERIPVASPPQVITVPEGASLVLIETDTDEYLRAV